VDMRESIEFLEVEIKCLEKEIEICNPNDDIDIQVIEANKNIIIKYNQVIILLQQGEKYKKYKLIVEKYKEYLDKLPTGCDSLKFYRLLKKYFPRETNEYN